ncbi:hypothetical protein GGI07_005403 [Coemansia sp. Benny D115]|nr:hypothetical protein GGI07_005403 [Coemansia sp. Benny D115]
MTRGNQREEARKRNLKKAEKNGGKKSSDKPGTSFKNKMENDAEIMRRKQQLAAEKAQQAKN